MADTAGAGTALRYGGWGVKLLGDSTFVMTFEGLTITTRYRFRNSKHDIINHTYTWGEMKELLEEFPDIKTNYLKERLGIE